MFHPQLLLMTHYKLQEHTAVALLAAGVVFALLGLLFPPMGSIHDSVLWIFAQCLIYAGSVLGVAGYLRSTQTANLSRRPRLRETRPPLVGLLAPLVG